MTAMIFTHWRYTDAYSKQEHTQTDRQNTLPHKPLSRKVIN